MFQWAYYGRKYFQHKKCTRPNYSSFIKVSNYKQSTEMLVLNGYFCYRMGSFNSAPKILNDDSQDNDIKLPQPISRNELLQYCQKRPYGQLMTKRSFRKPLRKRTNNNDSENLGIKFKKLNVVTEGESFLILKSSPLNGFFLACSDYITSPHSLRVFQWNILSQGK